MLNEFDVRFECCAAALRVRGASHVTVEEARANAGLHRRSVGRNIDDTRRM